MARPGGKAAHRGAGGGSEIQDVTALPASATAAMKPTSDPAAAGRLLDAHFVVQGLVNWSGNEITVTAWLVNSRTGQQLVRFTPPPTAYVTAYQKRRSTRILSKVMVYYEIDAEAKAADRSGRKPDLRDIITRAFYLLASDRAADYREALALGERAYAMAPDNPAAIEAAAYTREDIQFRGCSWPASVPTRSSKERSIYLTSFPTAYRPRCRRRNARGVTLRSSAELRRRDRHIKTFSAACQATGTRPSVYRKWTCVWAISKRRPRSMRRRNVKRRRVLPTAISMRAELMFARGDYRGAFESARRSDWGDGYEGPLLRISRRRLGALAGDIAGARRDAVRAANMAPEPCRISTIPRGYYSLPDEAWAHFQQGLRLAGVRGMNSATSGC